MTFHVQTKDLLEELNHPGWNLFNTAKDAVTNKIWPNIRDEQIPYFQNIPTNISNEEYDRLLIEDSGDLSKWELNTVLGYEQNRLISYPSSYFHGKYPNKAWKEGRQVFVMFYNLR